MNAPAILSLATIDIALIDDHELTRQGVRNLLMRDKRFRVVGEASTREEARCLMASARPHVALLDIRLGRESGIEVAKDAREQAPEVKILILSAYACDQYVAPLARLGVSGYLTKSASAVELKRAILEVAKGGMVFGLEVAASVKNVLVGQETPADYLPKGRESLTPRESEVLSYMCRGLKNSDVAGELGISLRTVETHVEHILVKLDARTRTQAVVNAAARGLGGR